MRLLIGILAVGVAKALQASLGSTTVVLAGSLCQIPTIVGEGS